MKEKNKAQNLMTFDLRFQDQYLTLFSIIEGHITRQHWRPILSFAFLRLEAREAIHLLIVKRRIGEMRAARILGQNATCQALQASASKTIKAWEGAERLVKEEDRVLQGN